MSSIDQRVVEMKFDNATFQRGVSTTISALDSLKKGLQLTGATKGLDDVSKSASKFSIRGMLDSLKGAMGGFSALGVVAATTLATITQKALAAGANLVKSLSVAPIMDGFREYELKMGSIQTILANTQRHGTSLQVVNRELDELNKYADKTIYNFAEMTKNASLFTNSGMKIEDATTVIKGFSNSAAASGTSAQGAAGAAYQLSQALSAGMIRLMDWRSLTNVGMGGKNMQAGIIQVADAMGTFNSATTSAEAATKDFNGSLEKKWLTADVMSNYLKIMSGDMKDAEMAALGLDAAAIKALKQQAQTALEAATKVRTLTALMSTLKEAVASGWTESFELIFGDFEEATSLFTGVSDAIGGMLGDSADARNQMLSDWKRMGGRTALIDGVKMAFEGVLSVIKPISEALREVFPAKTGRDLLNLSVAFREFARGLKIGEETTENLKRTFAGLFSIVSIGITILKGIVSGIVSLFGAVSDGEGSFLGFTANIGDMLVSFDKMLKKTGIIEGFFKTVGSLLALPINLMKAFATVVGNLFNGFPGNAAAEFGGAIDAIGKRFAPLGRVVETVRGWLRSLGEVFSRAGEIIGAALSGIGNAIATAFNGDNFTKTMDVINTALLGGLLLMIKRFFKNVGSLSVNVGGEGMLSGITNALDGVTGALSTMQTSLKADILLKIAGALALLTLSIVALAMIDGDKLAKGLIAIGIGFGGLSAGMIVLSNAISILGAAKLPFIAAAMVGIAAALVLLAGALKIMGSMSWEEIARGLTVLAGSLLIISAAMTVMSANVSGMVRTAAALLILGIALNAIAIALKIFATIQWEEMGRGLTALGASLAIVAAAMHLMPKGMVLQAAALVILAGALNAMAIALKLFATMNLEEIGRSLLVLSGSLVIIAASMRLMPGGATMLAQAAALVAVSVALNIMAGALKLMATMSVGDIAKSLITLAGSLLILAVGLKAMTGSLGGAAALAIAAGALAILTPVLIALGSVDTKTIVQGLLAIAGVFVVFGIAGYALAPVIPVIIGLAAAMVLIGAGFALAGAGALALATAFGIVVVAGAAGIAVLSGILSVFISAIPGALRAFGLGIVAFAKVIASAGEAFFGAITAVLGAILRAIVENAPKLAKAFTAIIDSFLRAVVTNAPKIAAAIGVILSNFLKVVRDNAPKIGQAFLDLIKLALRVLTEAVPRMAQAGLRIIKAVIKAVGDNVGGIVDEATKLITNFIDAIGRNLPKIIDSGVKLVISFVNGVANAIRNNTDAMNRAGMNLASAIVEGMAKGIAGGLSVVTGAAKKLAKGALDAAKGVLGIASPSKEFEKIGEFVTEGFVQGLAGGQASVNSALQTMTGLLSSAMESAANDVLRTKDQINSLREAREQDVVALDKATKAHNQARAELQATTNAHKALTTELVEESDELRGLSSRYDDLSTKLKNANQVLADAKKTRDDYNNSIKAKYSDLPEFHGKTNLTQYLLKLDAQVKDTNTFTTAVQKLRTLGLNDEVYKEILAKGIEALPFVNQLVDGGKGAVDEINRLSSNLVTSAGHLANQGSSALYEAGVQTAQALADGIASQLNAVKSEMDRLIEILRQALEEKLKLDRELAKPSPRPKSKEETKGNRRRGIGPGKYVGGKDQPTKTTRRRGIGADRYIDPKDSSDYTRVLQPVIIGQTPSIAPRRRRLTTSTAFNAATAASLGYNTNISGALATSASKAQTAPTFIQNNYSPKALSSAEIYRRTSSQLSRARG